MVTICDVVTMKTHTMKNLVPPATCVYHKPPPYYHPLAGVDEEDYYSTNPTIFGRILNGEAPSRNYAESLDLLAFRDRTL